MTRLVAVEVEQAPGSGVVFERDPRLGLVGRRVRPSGIWLGFDRAALTDSDDGTGRRTPVLVSLPASTFAGAMLEVELTGAWQSGTNVILVGRLHGAPDPAPAMARIVAGLGEEAAWLDRTAAELEAQRAHQRHRERQSHLRVRGGRAWHPLGALSPEQARFETPHSAAEYSLARLPHRFVRGLEGLLDDDERVLYWVERPAVLDLGIVERLRGRVDRRAALLALTDHQLLWIVDHAPPDRYLSDWGVDVELLPLERVLDVHCRQRDERVEIRVTTPAGSRSYVLPVELADEVRVMRDLVQAFTPAAAGRLPRRRYDLEAIPFEPEAAARFGQEARARSLYDAAADRGDVLAFLFSPSRPGQRSAAALVLREAAIELEAGGSSRAVVLAEITSLVLTLSPLVGRLAAGPGVRISYPGSLIDRGAAFVRLARRAIAIQA